MKAQTPRYFNRKLGIGIFLLPLSCLFWLGGKLAKILSVPYRAKAKVICIGNVVVGGVGKTPLVIKVVEHYLSLGKRVAVISRGYGSNAKRAEFGRHILENDVASSGIEMPVLVDYKKSLAIAVGDEPLMISRHFAGQVPVCVCVNRGIGLQMLDAMGIDVVVADDGLQNYSFAKDKVVVTFDGKDCIGNGWILPAGPLRETLDSGMEKADIVMMMRDKNPAFEKRLAKYGKPIFHARTEILNEQDFYGKEVVAFAGIGKPEKFYKSLGQCGANVVKKFDFPDHHRYTKSDIMRIVKDAEKCGAMVVTTEKDFVKIPAELAEKIAVLKIDIKIDNEDKFFKKLGI